MKQKFKLLVFILLFVFTLGSCTNSKPNNNNDDNPSTGDTPSDNPSTGDTPSDNPSTGDTPSDNPSTGDTPSDNPSTGDTPSDNPSTGDDIITSNPTWDNVNSSSTITILESAGHLEAAYVEWTGVTDAIGYNVYYKEKDSTIYTKIDDMLIRLYSDRLRADVVGLKAGSYTLKVVPVYTTGEGSDAATANVTVASHDRSGYAFQTGNDYSKKVVPGAYNMDGTLKDNARVLYITQNNFETVELEVHISASKTEVRKGLQNILAAYEKGYETQPLAIRIIGNINASGITLGGEAGTLQIKGKGTSSFNLTIEGIGDDANMYGWGLLVIKSNSVEIRNLATMLFNDDGISLKESKNVWVHNCDIFYGGTGGDADQAKGDGSLDIKDDSQNLTLSYIHFWDSGKMSLCGMKSETGENWITYHHNWFDHSDSRHPRVRTMTVHVYNNYYDGVSKYGVGVTTGASVFVENNYFYNTSTPMMSSMQGTDATGDGTFSGESGGIIKAYGNKMINDNPDITTRYITYQQNNTSFDAYEVSSRSEVVPSSVVTLSGNTTYNNFDTAATFYSYNLQSADDCVNTVKKYAGRMNGGDFSWDFSALSEDSNYAVNAEYKKALIDYKSKLVKVLVENVEADNGGTGGSTDSGEGENSGTNTPVIEGAVIHDFTANGTNSTIFTINGTLSSSKGSVTYDGKTLTQCLKLESSTSITFTTTAKMTLILVVNSEKNKLNAKVDGVKYEDSTGVITVEIEAGSHTITKGDTANLFYIVLNPIV